jgi:basic amino acid/polyamine antiporter, APA family
VDAVTQSQPDVPESGPTQQLFVRQATGLVRGVKPWTAAILNFCPGHPAQVLAVSFFFAFALFPGGNYLLAIAILLPLSVAMSYAFGLLTTMIPRDGGDYMLVSRVIHPAVGIISSFCMTVANLFSNAYFGIGFVTISLGPGLIAVGLIGHDPTFVNWGTTIEGSTAWKFGLGSAMMLIPVFVLATGWSWARRILNTMFWIVSGGLIVAVLIALFTSQGSFISDFNSFGRSYTGSGHAYAQTLVGAHKAGVALNPAFSMSSTLGMIGIFAGFSIYSYFATFVGGELRQGSSIGTAHNMAITGVVGLAGTALGAAIFFHAFGSNFLIAANSPAGLPGALKVATPTYWFLSGITVGSPVYTALLVLTYVVFWPLISYLAFLQPQRMLFAMSFDGLLPKKVAAVSKQGSPWVALVIAYILTEAVFLWSVKSASFIQVIVYATLFQLIAMALVGLSALVVPYLRPQFYQASASTRKFLGLPLVSIAGAVSMGTCAFIWFLYFHYSAQYGLVNYGRFFVMIAVVFALALGLFFGSAVVRRRQGVDLRMAYAEIPPE